MSSVTFVIPAAGTGSRLGMNMPKCLLEINGKPLLQWQLEAVDLFQSQIVVVVGYQADDVRNLVRRVSPRTEVVVNDKYLSTKTAASLKIGAELAIDHVVAIDGDLLVNPMDLDYFYRNSDEVLGIVPTVTKDCIGVNIQDDLIVEMGFHIQSTYEWSGPMKLHVDKISTVGSEHIFEGIQQYLPMKYKIVDAVEIDYLEDLPRAMNWLDSHTDSRTNVWIRN